MPAEISLNPEDPQNSLPPTAAVPEPPPMPVPAPEIPAAPSFVAPPVSSLPPMPGTPVKKNFPVWIGLAVVALLALAGFAFWNFFFVPLKTKEKARIVQPAFDEFDKSINKIADYLKDNNSGGFDSASMEREVEKSKNLVNGSKESLKSLQNVLPQLNLPSLKEYDLAIDVYVAKAAQVVNVNESLHKLISNLIGPVKDYETLEQELNGLSDYMYSDPDRYLASLSDVVEKEKKIQRRFEDIQAEGDFKELKDVFARRVEDEADFISRIKTAVENRSVEQIGEAQQVYVNKITNSDSELVRLTQKIDDQIEQAIEELKDAKKAVDDEYYKMRVQYRF